jgi:CRISPR-associated endonuclease/helicase Cas3
MLSVPLYRLRAFLAGSAIGGDMADVEGLPDGLTGGESRRIRPCLVWRGRERSRVARSAEDILPGDVVFLPAAYGMSGLGQSAPERALGEEAMDLWEPALESGGRPPAVRLNRSVLAPWLACPPLGKLLSLVEEAELDREAIRDGIEELLAYEPAAKDDAAAPPSWWLSLLREIWDSLGNARALPLERHPAGGVVLSARVSLKSFIKAEPDLFADDDDLTSASGDEVPLDEHSELVRRTVEKLAARCLPAEFVPVLTKAAYWHDAGKLDERFQILLHQGDELAALCAGAPLAKSSQIPVSPKQRQAIREASGLPRDFRHEMLSVQLAERFAGEPGGEAAGVALMLHLIGSHHGYARPFAPVSLDPRPPAVAARFGSIDIALRAEERAALPPPHRIDSGIAERFWQLVRWHGWWGLAYLEAVVRLGDWYASGLRLNEKTDAGAGS